MATTTIESELESTAEGDRVVCVQHDEPSDPEKANGWLPVSRESCRLPSRFHRPKWSLVDGSDDVPRVVPAAE